MIQQDTLNSEIQTVSESADCLYDLAAVENAIDRMASEITSKLKNKNPLFLCVMIGGLIPMGRLLTRLHFPLEVDYLHVTRYQSTTRGGTLHWLVTPRQTLEGRTIVVFDDIMDGGLTLASILDHCKEAKALEVYSAVLVNKIREREPGVKFVPDFIGLNTENRYLFGYGLDYKEYLRNAPGIYAVAKEHE